MTGGSGYLGSHLVDLLLKHGSEVTILDKQFQRTLVKDHEYPRRVICDISKVEDFEKLNEIGSFDGVFHLAAKKSVSESIRSPEIYTRANEIGTRNILEFAFEKNIKRIVFTSSAAVYGEINTSLPISENQPADPINPYGLTKLNSEKFISESCLLFDLSAISLRTFNIVGTSNERFFDLDGENLFSVIARKLVDDQNFTVFGKDFDTIDGTSVRDYVNVWDVANAHFLAMKYMESNFQSNRGHEVLNVSSGVGTSILEIITQINSLSAGKLRWNFGDRRIGDPAIVIGNNTKARDLLNWAPLISLEQSIQETLKCV